MARLTQADQGSNLDASTPELFAKTYQELRAVAHGFLRRERVDHTLTATALVHEAFVKVARIDGDHWRDRGHFLAVVIRSFRRVLATHVTRRNTQRRSGSGARSEVDLESIPGPNQDWDWLEIHEALECLEVLDARQARIVELRFFGGLTVTETAQVLGLSVRTVVGEWAHSRAWLYRHLGAELR